MRTISGSRAEKPRIRTPWILCKSLGADDRARTGDLDLGKVALYQLSYVRVVLKL
jgi:hypothetical protein